MEKERKRRMYSAEYKAETVQLLQRSGKKHRADASELGLERPRCGAR